MDLMKLEEKIKMYSSLGFIRRKLILRSILKKNPGISKEDLIEKFLIRIFGDDILPRHRDKIIAHFRKTADLSIYM